VIAVFEGSLALSPSERESLAKAQVLLLGEGDRDLVLAQLFGRAWKEALSETWELRSMERSETG
jgi:hypothetical protein